MNASNRLPFRLACVAALLAVVGPVARAQTATPAVASLADDKKVVVYKLSPTDKISINIVGEPEYNVGGKRLDANGKVNLALVGDLKLAGLSVNQAQAAIETAYRDGLIFRNPQVTINIEEYAPRTVSISGLVKQPGTVNLPPEATMTIKELILKVGGFAETAKGSAVKITRVMPDGNTKVMTVDVESILKGKKTDSSTDNVVLEPDDIVYVPEKLI